MGTRKKDPKKPTPPAPRRAKRRIQLMVIPAPEPNTRAILEAAEGLEILIMKGEGSNLVMECGACGAPLVEGVPVTAIRNLVFRCPRCREFNETIA
jgi:hypothetical protein